ncbi:D-alanyl-D-alanine carboxypeptidase [Lusitaniella coriacea LEGE 07157]|uniref:D-alanyl-D-alanine carboxypeptidase n=1 Tax=Lusitaniella coriacea LEGE 07157 TaxID=945747 RepID=A0A8J7JEC0_9CYAN|nr:D-alanyl-D-alanine carboxypeptidase [Lusitaniella coriacea]MBE9118780.1 D-alanyl-D-alanine carboxypeptidase [Lusitaniella coriacea LEGE 07157]
MLEVVAASVISLFAGILGQPSQPVPTVESLSWQNAKLFQLPPEPDPVAEEIVRDYLKALEAQGLAATNQGVWIESDFIRLARHQGTQPRSAASLTKIATTLAAIDTWGLDRHFETRFYANGNINGGVLKGDLIVIGDGDPMFVWEEAVVVGNALNKLGIRKVTGNLIVNSKFYMNFYPNSAVAGKKLKEGLNSKVWSSEAQIQHGKMPPGTPRPTVEVQGNLLLGNALPPSSQLLLTHQSLKMYQILKQMNIYSNNMVAEALGQLMGGGDVVAQIAANVAEVPPEEINLINGSGLGTANRISPRAVTAMLQAIEGKLQDHSTSLPDLFPVAGRDTLGTMLDRNLPSETTIKTGTLARVSALAGVLPTQKYGWVWFAVINDGSNIEALRQQQDRLLQRLSQNWGAASISATLKPNDVGRFGDPDRVRLTNEKTLE